MKSNYIKLRHTPKGVLFILIAFLGLISRGPVAVYAPIAKTIQNELQVNSAVLGLLSGIPVFCFAAFTPIASFIIGKKGLESTVKISLSVMFLGLVVRLFGNFELIFLSTVILGIGISFSNIAVPLLVRRDFGEKFTSVIGIYSLASNTGNFATSMLTVPLSMLMGWRLGIFTWSLLVISALVICEIYIHRKKRGLSRKALKKQLANNPVFYEYIINSDSKKDDSIRNDSSDSKNSKGTKTQIITKSFCIGVCVVFICQCFCLFSFLAWLPSIFQSHGMNETTAGIAASLFTLLGILGSVVTPKIIKKLNFLKTFIIIALFWLSLPVGMAFFSNLWFIWICLAGIAQAGNYMIVFASIASFSKDLVEVRRISATVQSTAYLVAGIAPTSIGAVYDHTHSWKLPFLIWIGLMATMLFVGILTYGRAEKRLDR